MRKELNTMKMWPDEFNNCFSLVDETESFNYLLQTDAKLNIIFSNQPNGEKTNVWRHKGGSKTMCLYHNKQNRYRGITTWTLYPTSEPLTQIGVAY